MVEKVTIVYSKNFIEYLDDLVKILYFKEYFGFIESADMYTDKIYDFIEINISTFPSKKTPIQLQHLGSNYVFYQSNQRTTWYIFFEQSNSNYLITNIINSHNEEIKWL
jgi:hypothetical protein